MSLPPTRVCPPGAIYTSFAVMEAVVEGFFPDLAGLLKSTFPSVWALISYENIACTTPFILLNGKIVTHPVLGVSAVAGLLIGLLYGIKLLNLYRSKRAQGNHAYLFYGLSFLFFSGMNVGGIFFHCLQPPMVYLETVPDAFPSLLVITHFAHVLDVCSTCCASLSFLIGRLHAIDFLQTSDPSFYYIFFSGIYLFGYVGMIPTSPDSSFAMTVPFVAEILYPGVIGLVLAVLPFCRWQRIDYPILLLSMIVLSLAFGLAGVEGFLCQSFGPYFTAAGWCFFFSDLTFLLLAQLSDLTMKEKKS
jgi:hypothetical protein